VITFGLLAWWQIDRARGGNALSFGYAFEWPLFALFVIFVWVKEIRRVLRDGSADGAAPQAPAATADSASGVLDSTSTPTRTAPPRVVSGVAPPRSAPRRRLEAAYDDSDDAQLAAYNRYLAWLNANPHASPMDYPG
jgi:hypothetical protein